MEIRITYSRDGGRERAMGETAFRSTLARTLAQIGDGKYGPTGYLAGQEHLTAAAGFIDSAGFQEHLDAEQLSLLGTFGVIANDVLEEGAVPAGCACPCCGEDQMDNIAPQDDGSFECMSCRAEYSGELDAGRPNWKRGFDQRTGRHLPKLYYVPAFDRYVSIPDGEED